MNDQNLFWSYKHDVKFESELYMNKRSWLMHLVWLLKLLCACCAMPWNNLKGQQIWKSIFTQCYERITLFSKLWKLVLIILWYTVGSYKLPNLRKYCSVSKCAPMIAKVFRFQLLRLMFTCGLMDAMLIIMNGSNFWSG